MSNIKSIRITSFFESFSNLVKKVPFFVKCFRCGDFLSTEDFKFKHDFLKHYDDGQNVPFQDRPVEIKKTSAITSYEISVNKYRDYYDFENAEQVVNDFLRNVRSKFKPKRQGAVKVWVSN